MKLTCLHCGSPLTPNDVNAPADIAVCPACGESFQLSVRLQSDLGAAFGALRAAPAVASEQQPPVDLNAPPKGVTVEERGDAMIISANTRSCFAFFLVPFLCVWTGGVILGMGEDVTRAMDGDLDSFVPVIVFLIFLGVGFSFWAIALLMIFGKVIITVGTRDAEIFTGAFGMGKRKRLDIAAITDVREEIKQGNKSTYTVIVLDGAEPYSFGTMLSDARRRYILGVLRALFLPDASAQSYPGGTT